MLAAFGLAGGTAGVHEEERSIGVLRDGLDGLSRKIFQNFVHIKIAAMIIGASEVLWPA